MNRRLARNIVRVLGVDGRAADRVRDLENFGETDWRRTLSWLDDSALALYLLDAVDRAGRGDILPAPVYDRIARSLESNRHRTSVMKEEFQRFNRHLDATGVEYAVLKGFALVPDYCPDAALRSQYDYDYLVSGATIAGARAALESLGYSRKVQSPGHEPEDVIVLEPRTAVPQAETAGFYDATLPRGIELHTRLWEYEADGVDVGVPGDVLERRRRVSWDSLSFPALDDVDALLFQVLHSFHHLLDHWCRLSCFLEIARFLERRKSDDGFWERFGARVHGLRSVPEVTGLILAMARLLFDSPLPPKVSGWAVTPPAAERWVRLYGLDWALTPFPGSKLTLFVHRTFVRDAATWGSIRRARLFPWHRPARIAQSGDEGGQPTNPEAAWTNRWKHWRFVAGRVRFHLVAALEYAWHWPRWRRSIRQA